MLADVLLVLVHPFRIILGHLVLLLQHFGELDLAQLHLLPQLLVLSLHSAQVVLVLGRPVLDLLVEADSVLLQLVLS